MSRHTREFEEKEAAVRAALNERESGPDPRLEGVVAGLRAGLDSPEMLRAARIMFEDYTAVRVCVRAMMKLFLRRLCPRRAAEALR